MPGDILPDMLLGKGRPCAVVRVVRGQHFDVLLALQHTWNRRQNRQRFSEQGYAVPVALGRPFANKPGNSVFSQRQGVFNRLLKDQPLAGAE